MGKPLGVILAGGLARRMGGGDKSLLGLGQLRVLDQVISLGQNQEMKIIEF